MIILKKLTGYTLLFGIFSLIITAIIVFETISQPQPSPRKHTNSYFRNNLNQKKFLYLINVKQCLSEHHLQIDNGLADNRSRDIIALSYGEKCKLNRYTHVTYVYTDLKTSWTTGRNFLYQYARKYYNYTHMYYIFSDEDIVLSNNIGMYEGLDDRFSEETMKIAIENKNPYEKFEEFLDNYRPAIASVENFYNLILKFSYGENLSPVYSSFFFDAQFNAYHQDTFYSMLPYEERYENESWWISQEVNMCKAFFRYHGHMVQYLPLYAKNMDHKEYPQGIRPPSYLCKQESEKAPESMLHYDVTLEMLSSSDFRDIDQMRQIYGYVAPPKTPIKQYAYFGGKFSDSSN